MKAKPKALYESAPVLTVMLALTVILPIVTDLFSLLQITIYVVMAILALSLALVWGGAGILCFGQAAFFGLGAYTYAVAAMNFGDSTYAILLGMLVPSLFALALGYFMFIGRLSELYIGVITLSVSLILFNFMNSTSDPRYKIGVAPLNGFNGMSSIPSFNMPFNPSAILSPTEVFYVTMVSLMIIYALIKYTMASTYGRIVVSVRENEVRAELLGYNIALVKLGIFVMGAAIAGYAGCLFVNWNGFVSPHVFSLTMTAQTIIWIIVGGRGTYVGPIVGAVFIQWLSLQLGADSPINASVVMGVILMIFVVLVPKGTVPTIKDLFVRLVSSNRTADRPDNTDQTATDARR